MKSKFATKLLSLLLVVCTIMSIAAVPASAVSTGSITESKTATIKYLGRMEILKKTGGTSMGASSWSYTTNTGITGTGYCVNWGLNMVSASKALTLQEYNRNPQTMGAFANGYPMRTLEQFKQLHSSDVRGVANLTEAEYEYATQVAVWATCGQIAVPGTKFTSGRSSIIVPTSDAQQIRVYDSLVAILGLAAGWTKNLYTGMYLRGELDKDIRTVEIVNELGLEGAAKENTDGIKKETINGVEYYTRTMYVASATSTWIDGYTTKVYSTDAPAGTIFVDENNRLWETETSNGVTYYKVDTSKTRNTNMNVNGSEYYGAFKVCIPVDNVTDTGSFQIKSIGGVAQYNLYLAYNPSATEQSYIISDPGYTTLESSATLKWNGESDTDLASLQVVKSDGAGTPLAGAIFQLTGSKGTTVTGRTDMNGQIIWRDLPADETYTLTETQAPEGFLITAPINVTLSGGRTSYLTVRDSTENTFQVKKIDAQNKGALQGAVFRFDQIDGSYTTTGITGFDGVIEFLGDELPYGAYRVSEESAPEGYLKDTSVQTVEWTGEHDVTLVFENVREIGVTIMKADSRTGVSLPGAVFDVYMDGERITSVTTNDAGEAYVTGIKQECYVEFVETAAPTGYVLDSTPHGIHIDPYNPAVEDDPILVVTNEAMAALRIKKYDAQTNQPVPNVTFEVYRDTELFGTYQTNEDGEIFLYDLEPGTYLVQEVAAGDSYVVNSTPQQIELKAGATQTYNLVFLNYLKPGIHLTKLDSQTMKPLANTRFRISQVGGDYSKEFLTDINGEIDLTALEPGAYLVEELEAPKGYLIDDAQRVINIQGGENAVFVFTDTPKPSLVIEKYDAQQKNHLPGATYRIAKIEDGSHYLDRITDTEGRIVLTDLEPGVYSVQEMSAPAGFVLDETEYHVELFAGKTSTLVLCDDAKPDLRIVKKDADTGDLLEGAVFKINKVDSSTVTTEQTDENGEIFLEDLEPGVWQITEVSPPEGYLPAEEPTQLITLEPNKLGTAIFENHAKPGLVVNKIDTITKDPIQHARFHVVYGSNSSFTGEINDLGYYYTDENGQFKLTGLQDGWYKVTEVESASGYAIKDPDTQEFFIKSGQSKSITFENTPLSAIIIKKVDAATGDPLQGAWFRLRYLGGTSGTGGTIIGEYQTSVNGTIVVTGLKAGTYVAEEISAPNGYVLSENDIQTAYLSGKDQDVITLTFGNKAKGSLLIKKIDSVTNAPLADVDFSVTRSDGSYVGNANGVYATDSAGSILINDLEPGETLIVKEVRAKDGYILDDTPQSIKIISGETVSLEFRNAPKGSLVIVKKDSVTGKPLKGVEFTVKTSDGRYVANNGGKVSSNGIYYTDANGQIILTGLEPGTYVVTESRTISGYILDESPQTVVVNEDDTQTLTFWNTPSGGLQIIKSDEDTGERISGVKFEVRKINGEIIGTYTTDRNGVISLPDAESGWYTVTELKAASGYQLDTTPANICVKDGQTATLEITNKRMSSIMIHKVDADTGKGIYGVTFILYDSGKNPVGEYTTDQDGYIWIEDELEEGRYYLRELEAADGYTLDTQYKTVYVERGKCAQIEWKNKAVTGQIQVRKYASDANAITGAKAGAALEGAVYEITQARSGTVVGYIVTDAHGVAASDPLPLGRYYVTEVSAPAYYQLSGEKMEAEIEYAGQIIKLTDYNKSVKLGVTIKKTGNKEVQPGNAMRYTISGISNTSNVALNNFFWHDRLPTDATSAVSLTTGTYNQRLYYRITFKTNTNDYRVLASNLLTTNNYSIKLTSAALGLAQGEYVTDIRFEFGTVASGFASSINPTIQVQVNGNVTNGYNIINRVDVGGQYLNEWQTAQASWLTTVYRFQNNTPLPKTGY